MKTAETNNERDYGCDDCKYLKGNRCTMWEVKVDYPYNSHCEVVTSKYGQAEEQ